eukprot:9350491-Pyramimonas_sp.AAC.1
MLQKKRRMLSAGPLEGRMRDPPGASRMGISMGPMGGLLPSLWSWSAILADGLYCVLPALPAAQAQRGCPLWLA